MSELIRNLNKFAGRKRIRDRGIQWEETYRKRSKPLKERFNKQIGPGSYYRWEGYDYTTNSMYYVVVGPSVHRRLGKVFFAGIKKLPFDLFEKDPDTATYSPYGEYFHNMKAALMYASKRWGIIFPKGQPQYKKENLLNADVPEHVKT